MVIERVRMDELVSAWVNRPETPQHIALLGVFDGGPVLGGTAGSTSRGSGPS